MEDPYTEPTTGLLRNRLGITDLAELTAAESDISLAVMTRLLARPLTGQLRPEASAGLPSGDLRQRLPVGRGDQDGGDRQDGSVLPAAHIRPYADGVFADLAVEKHLRDLSRDEFVDRLTHYYAEVNAIHPFREGNGRTQRAFFGQLSRGAGLAAALGWTGRDETSPHRSHRCGRDNGPLRGMLNRLVVPRALAAAHRRALLAGLSLPQRSVQRGSRPGRIRVSASRPVAGTPRRRRRG